MPRNRAEEHAQSVDTVSMAVCCLWKYMYVCVSTSLNACKCIITQYLSPCQRWSFDV